MTAPDVTPDDLVAPVPAEPLDLPETVEWTPSGLVSRAVNADGLTETTVFEDRADGGLDVRTHIALDVEPVIDAVHAEHMATGGKSQTGELWHIGEIPIPVMVALANKLGLRSYMELTKPEFMPYVIALCRDSDYRRLSPTGGKA